MASKQSPVTSAALGAAPASLDDHNADMERREAVRRSKRARLLDCLDPTVAKRHEDAKELYEWKVDVKLFRAAKGRVAAHMQDFSEKVVAQTQQDAWAMFCDKIGEWPSYRDCAPKFTQLKRRTLREPERETQEV